MILKEAKKLFDKGAIFLDARSSKKYKKLHIKGAYSFPVGSFDEYYKQFRKSNWKNTTIVLYCSGTGCRLSEKLARILQDKGYTNLVVFTEGIYVWRDAGYPVENDKNITE